MMRSSINPTFQFQSLLLVTVLYLSSLVVFCDPYPSSVKRPAAAGKTVFSEISTVKSIISVLSVSTGRNSSSSGIRSNSSEPHLVQGPLTTGSASAAPPKLDATLGGPSPKLRKDVFTSTSSAAQSSLFSSSSLSVPRPDTVQNPLSQLPFSTAHQNDSPLATSSSDSSKSNKNPSPTDNGDDDINGNLDNGANYDHNQGIISDNDLSAPDVPFGTTEVEGNEEGKHLNDADDGGGGDGNRDDIPPFKLNSGESFTEPQEDGDSDQNQNLEQEPKLQLDREYTPAEIAEYILSTGDEKGFVQVVAEMVQDGAIKEGRDDVILFLEAVQKQVERLRLGKGSGTGTKLE